MLAITGPPKFPTTQKKVAGLNLPGVGGVACDPAKRTEPDADPNY